MALFKKVSAATLALLISASTVTASAASEKILLSSRYGDADNNSVINVRDIVSMTEAILNPENDGNYKFAQNGTLRNYDFNFNGAPDSYDALALKKMIAGGKIAPAFDAAAAQKSMIQAYLNAKKSEIKSEITTVVEDGDTKYTSDTSSTITRTGNVAKIESDAKQNDGTVSQLVYMETTDDSKLGVYKQVNGGKWDRTKKDQSSTALQETVSDVIKTAAIPESANIPSLNILEKLLLNPDMLKASNFKNAVTYSDKETGTNYIAIPVEDVVDHSDAKVVDTAGTYIIKIDAATNLPKRIDVVIGTSTYEDTMLVENGYAEFIYDEELIVDIEIPDYARRDTENPPVITEPIVTTVDPYVTSVTTTEDADVTSVTTTEDPYVTSVTTTEDPYVTSVTTTEDADVTSVTTTEDADVTSVTTTEDAVVTTTAVTTNVIVTTEAPAVTTEGDPDFGDPTDVKAYDLLVEAARALKATPNFGIEANTVDTYKDSENSYSNKSHAVIVRNGNAASSKATGTAVYDGETYEYAQDSVVLNNTDGTVDVYANNTLNNDNTGWLFKNSAKNVGAVKSEATSIARDTMDKTLQQIIDKKTDEVEKVKEDLLKKKAVLEEKAEALKVRKAELEDAKKALEDKKADLENRKNELEKDKEDFLAEYDVNSADMLNEDARAKYDELVAKGEALEAEAEEAKTEAENLKAEAEEFVAEAEKAQAEADALVQEAEAQKAKYEKQQAEFEKFKTDAVAQAKKQFDFTFPTKNELQDMLKGDDTAKNRINSNSEVRLNDDKTVYTIIVEASALFDNADKYVKEYDENGFATFQISAVDYKPLEMKLYHVSATAQENNKNAVVTVTDTWAKFDYETNETVEAPAESDNLVEYLDSDDFRDIIIKYVSEKVNIED